MQTSIMQKEDGLLSLLKDPRASRKQKQDACRELALLASARAVPVLADLLGDVELSHMARYALEPIRDPAVDAAFREALGRVKGPPLAGVVGSLGVRRDEKAVSALAKLLSHKDPTVAATTARALGKIGNAEAAKALQAELKDPSSAQFKEVCEGLFRCAESLAAEGEKQQARTLYNRLRKFDKAPQQIRIAATRGVLGNMEAGRE